MVHSDELTSSKEKYAWQVRHLDSTEKMLNDDECRFGRAASAWQKLCKAVMPPADAPLRLLPLAVVAVACA